MYLTLKPAASLRNAQCGSASEAERDLDFCLDVNAYLQFLLRQPYTSSTMVVD